MKMKVSQLRNFINKEISKLLSENINPTFSVGDLVRSKNPRYGVPLYAKREDGTADLTRTIGELPPHEDAIVLGSDPSGNPGVLLKLQDGTEAFVTYSGWLIVASGPSRIATFDKEFYITFISTRGVSRNKMILAKSAAEAEEQAKKLARLGEKIEIEEV